MKKFLTTYKIKEVEYIYIFFDICAESYFSLASDLEACVWLEESLKNFDRILVVVSHSQDFLNGVCTNIIHMQSKQLKYYTGNFDQYCQTRSELEENQMKQYR